jgi:hypothetical protein
MKNTDGTKEKGLRYCSAWFRFVFPCFAWPHLILYVESAPLCNANAKNKIQRRAGEFADSDYSESPRIQVHDDVMRDALLLFIYHQCNDSHVTRIIKET